MTSPFNEVPADTDQGERFQLLVRILEPADYRFIEMRNPAIQRQFRRDRMRIFRKELKRIAADSRAAYHRRLSRISASGQWNAYGPLLMDTMSSFVSIQKLRLASRLFAWHLPNIVDINANTAHLVRYLTVAAASEAPHRSH